MSAESWNTLFLFLLVIFTILNIILMLVIARYSRINKWARDKIHKLITGDNVDMSIETLSIYYHISPERIDQLLVMEKEYIDDGK